VVLGSYRVYTCACTCTHVVRARVHALLVSQSVIQLACGAQGPSLI